MDKQAKEKIKNLIGEGKLYEVELYNDEAALYTNEKDFNFSSDLIRLTYFDEVTNTESPIVNHIKEFFGDNEVRIIAYSDHYSNIDAHKTHFMFKRFNKMSCVPDTDCYYIVSTPNKKGKIKNFNLPDSMFVQIF